mgnify:FL=1|jgi:hypothetical protein
MDYASIFRDKLAGQAEVCARKTLERLQKNLHNETELTPEDIFYLASAAQILLNVRDTYGKK